MSDILPPGPELAARNRRVFARLENWPAGVVEVCEAIDVAHPGWHSSWSGPIGYYATRPGVNYLDENGVRKPMPPVYSETADALVEAIEDWTPPTPEWPAYKPLYVPPGED